MHSNQPALCNKRESTFIARYHLYSHVTRTQHLSSSTWPLCTCCQCRGMFRQGRILRPFLAADSTHAINSTHAPSTTAHIYHQPHTRTINCTHAPSTTHVYTNRTHTPSVARKHRQPHTYTINPPTHPLAHSLTHARTHSITHAHNH